MSTQPPVETDLARRFAAHVRARGLVRADDGVVVALSGGLDSVVLLHLFRFALAEPPLSLTAAHVDHGMRADSAADARWVAELCDAWGVPVRACRLDPAPASEAEARLRRYAFLEATRRAVGARWLVTAHHADDQAETVLFRILRGTGLAGLRGVRERRPPWVWRPLLRFTREELSAHAAAHGLTWREDPTNRSSSYARNVLRGRILPDVEASVAPGARRALSGLARRAAADEAAWRSLEDELLGAAGLRAEEDGYSLDAAAVGARHPAVRARLLRALARRLGVVPSEAGTRQAVEFTRAGTSGGSVSLGGGLTLRRELDRLLLARGEAAPLDVEAALGNAAGGSSEAVIGGTRFRGWWVPGPVGVVESGGAESGDAGGEGAEGGGPERDAFRIADLRFPLSVRGWRPGDRIRLEYGSKKLKKVFLEARVPPGKRHRIPVLVDAAGAVLWVPGVIRGAEARPTTHDEALTIWIIHAPPA